jgi:hypothetical protein
MKKKILYLVTVISLAFIFNSCGKNKLDILPLDILSTDQVFSDESAIKAYLASMYNQMPMEDFSFYGLFHPLSDNTDEALNVNERQRNFLGTGSTQSFWGYAQIRNVNDFIAKVPKSPLNESVKKTLLGEAMFIRAFDYFQMVKRYGGVPIIKSVQVFNGSNLDELKVLRNTEKEVYDFVSSDLDSAVLLLPETNEKGRLDKYAALALKSRVMLFAASSAKYATVQLNGLVGIPAADANTYWQAAMDAANAVITSGKYSLYNGNANKTENFREMFLLSDNPEAIFSKFYSYPDKVHSYDAFYLPVGIRGPSGFGSNLAPTLDLVEQFEYIDGTSGPLAMGTTSAPIYYSNPLDIYKNRDPRLLATVTVPFSKWTDKLIDIQAGIYDNGVKTESMSYATLYNPTTHQIDNVNGTLHVAGSNGYVSGESTATGFYVRKYMDPTLAQALAKTGGSSQPYIEIRYAEVLLNYAEAAMELNNAEEAKAKVNMVRARAGIALLNDASTTLARIRHERLVELAFENHRWWDYRRWRISDKIFNNLWVKEIRPYWDIQANAYRFERAQAGVYPKTFPPSLYYEKIATSQIATNEKLVQNPGY